LVNAAYLENDIKIKGEEQGVVICPGPNLAYFDKEVSLLDMVKHIYGTTSILGKINRPNVFINELKMYVDYLKNEVDEVSNEMTTAQAKKLQAFKSNLLDGIEYYVKLFKETKFFKTDFVKIQNQLHDYKSAVLGIEIPELQIA
jgi:uncharacterized coiled-coil DUF342 family protein